MSLQIKVGDKIRVDIGIDGIVEEVNGQLKLITISMPITRWSMRYSGKVVNGRYHCIFPDNAFGRESILDFEPRNGIDGHKL